MSATSSPVSSTPSPSPHAAHVHAPPSSFYPSPTPLPATSHPAIPPSPPLSLPTSPSSSSSSSGPFPPLSVLSALEGKTVFLTGGTGFVGKVILEKVLRSVPTIGRIYMLVRPRKGSTADERLEAEVFESPIFTRLKHEIGAERFSRRVKDKVRSMAGELTQSNVGLSASDMETLVNQCDIFIHCAAIVDFNERLDRAIELNVLGSLRMLNIAKQSTRLSAFIHVSTAYVNSNRRGWMDERLYPLGFDANEMLARVSQMKATELEKITGTGILGDWPNTYTFTKAMTEHLLTQQRGSVPLAIVRPSIVGGSAREPVPGWVDVISAAGAVYLSVGLGVLKFLPGSEHNMGDVVPVDYVTNVILAAIPAISNRNTALIFHAATSSERPMYWGNACQVVVKYFLQHPAQRRLAPPTFKMIPSPQNYQLQFFMHYSVPSALLNVTAPIGSKKYQMKAQQFDRLVFRARVIVEAFRHFVENEWQFNNMNVRQLHNALNEKERELFPMDLSDFDWDEYNYYFGHGLMRYVLKSDLNPIAADHARTLNLNDTPWKPRPKQRSYTLKDNLQPYMPDLTYMHTLWQQRTRYPPARPMADMRRLILQQPAVQAAIRAENEAVKAAAATSAGKKKSAAGSGGRSAAGGYSAGESRARLIMDKMFGETNMPVLQSESYLFKKLWQRIYDVIAVEAANLNAAKRVAKQAPIILIPTHRSYVDFLIVSYVCFLCDLPIPHIAAGEDFLGIYMVRWLFRQSGAFFMKRSMDSQSDPLYTAVFNSYMQQLLMDGQSIEFFIEGTRSRSGKMLQPKQGLLSVLTDAYFDGKVQDAYIVPVSINYEKTMEGEIYSNELLGEGKIRESLRSLLRSSSVLSSKFGSIAVNFATPISLKEYAQQHMALHADTPTIEQLPVPSFEMTVNGNGNGSGETAMRPSSKKPRTALAPADAQYGIAASPVSSSPSSSASAASPSSPSSSSTSSVAGAPASASSLSAGAGGSSFVPLFPSPPPRPSGSYDPFRSRVARKYFNHALSYDIVYSLQCESAVLPTAIVASLLLMYRQGISSKQLVAQVDWVGKQLQERGAKTLGLQGEDRVLLVDRALKHLRPLVRERRAGHYEAAIIEREEYRNMLVLGHYRNKLLHHFYREGLWACALYAFGDAAETGVKQSRLLTEVTFLHALLQREFVVKPDPAAPERFEDTLQTMIGRGILRAEKRTRSQQSEHTKQAQQSHAHQHQLHTLEATVDSASASTPAASSRPANDAPLSFSSTSVNAYVDDVNSSQSDVYVEVSGTGETSFSFLCALFWPFIDSYYAAAMTLFSLQPDHRIDEQALLQRCQWLSTTLYAEGMMSFYESCSLDTLRNAFELLKTWGVIAKDKVSKTTPAAAGEAAGPAAAAAAAGSGSGAGGGGGSSKVVVYLLGVYKVEAGLQQLVNRIGRLRKQPPVRKTAGRRNLIADIPILAKL